MIRRLIILLLIVGCGTEPEDYNAINSYQLEDLNSNSSSFGQTLSHNTFSGKIILYYFSYHFE